VDIVDFADHAFEPVQGPKPERIRAQHRYRHAAIVVLVVSHAEGTNVMGVFGTLLSRFREVSGASDLFTTNGGILSEASAILSQQPHPTSSTYDLSIHCQRYFYLEYSLKLVFGGWYWHCSSSAVLCFNCEMLSINNLAFYAQCSIIGLCLESTPWRQIIHLWFK